jgi:hypothetical protein
MGSIRQQHPSNTPGRDQPAGKAGPAAAAATGCAAHRLRLIWSDPLNHTSLHVQARETGICPVREELYAQCFDELIRQVTINCAERGLLLLRVRDEMRMTVAAYQVFQPATKC